MEGAGIVHMWPEISLFFLAARGTASYYPIFVFSEHSISLLKHLKSCSHPLVSWITKRRRIYLSAGNVPACACRAWVNALMALFQALLSWHNPRMDTSGPVLVILLLVLVVGADAVPLMALEIVGVIGGMTPIPLNGSCISTHDVIYSLYKVLSTGSELIGQYDGHFEGFLNFTDHLHFAVNSCSFVLSNLTKEHGGNYEFNVLISVNHIIKSHTKMIHISVADPAVSLVTADSSAGHHGNMAALLAACFSWFPTFQTAAHVGAFIWWLLGNPRGLAWLLLVTSIMKMPIFIYLDWRRCACNIIGQLNLCCPPSSFDRIKDAWGQSSVCQWIGRVLSFLEPFIQHTGFSVCVLISYFVTFHGSLPENETLYLIISAVVSFCFQVSVYLLLCCLCYKPKSENQSDKTQAGSEPTRSTAGTDGVSYAACPVGLPLDE